MTGPIHFYVLAIAVGLAQGGVQALRRSLFMSMIPPPSRFAQFFGFYYMLGKFAAVLGAVLVGFVAMATDSSRLGILSLLLLFGLGGTILYFGDPAKASQAAHLFEENSEGKLFLWDSRTFRNFSRVAYKIGAVPCYTCYSSKKGSTGKMLANINIHSSVAVYVQIENEVQFAIASGKLKHADRLPSVRELSERIDVNPNTVAKAYRDLEVMGLLYTRRGMGVFIEKGVAGNCRDRCYKRILERLHEVTQEAKAAGMKKGDLTDALGKSFAIESSPYGEVPQEVRAVMKGK